jgi:hypothetical protein
MKNHLLAIAVSVVAALTACGTTSPNGTQTSTSASAQQTPGPAPLIYFQSKRPPSSISSCLASRISGLQKHVANGTTDLTTGGRSGHYAWLIELTPSGSGSVVKVQKSPGDDDSVPEPEMRFDIARCSV